MTMEYLRHVAKQRLPYEVFTVPEINKLSVLRAAELVAAFIPPPGAIQHDEANEKPATVLAITKAGRLALRKSAEASM
jgi:hypothetical protein